MAECYLCHQTITPGYDFCADCTRLVMSWEGGAEYIRSVHLERVTEDRHCHLELWDELAKTKPNGRKVIRRPGAQ